MSAVLRIAGHLSIDVCLPEIVVEESVNARLEAAESAAEQLGNAINQASKLFELDPIYIPNPAETAQLWREELETRFKILELDPNDAKEALFREANRVPPARKGSGGRDAAIWLTARRHQQDYAETMFFVSANTEDFGDKATPGLHSKLQAEVSDDYGPIEFFRSLDGLLDRLATKVDASVDSSTLELMADDLLEGILATGALGDLWSSEESANAEVKVATLKVVRSYSVDDVILAHCDVTAFVHIPPETDSSHKRVSLRLRCWLEIDQTTSRPNALDVLELMEVRPIPDD